MNTEPDSRREGGICETIFYSVDDTFLMLNYQLFPGNWIQSHTHYTDETSIGIYINNNGDSHWNSVSHRVCVFTLKNVNLIWMRCENKTFAIIIKWKIQLNWLALGLHALSFSAFICHKSVLASIFAMDSQNKIDVNAKIINYLFWSEPRWDPRVFFQSASTVVIRLRLSLNIQLVSHQRWMASDLIRRKIMREDLMIRQRHRRCMMV